MLMDFNEVVYFHDYSTGNESLVGFKLDQENHTIEIAHVGKSAPYAFIVFDYLINKTPFLDNANILCRELGYNNTCKNPIKIKIENKMSGAMDCIKLEKKKVTESFYRIEKLINIHISMYGKLNKLVGKNCVFSILDLADILVELGFLNRIIECHEIDKENENSYFKYEVNNKKEFYKIKPKAYFTERLGYLVYTSEFGGDFYYLTEKKW